VRVVVHRDAVQTLASCALRGRLQARFLRDGRGWVWEAENDSAFALVDDGAVKKQAVVW